jgi:hypothetical protein
LIFVEPLSLEQVIDDTNNDEVPRKAPISPWQFLGILKDLQEAVESNERRSATIYSAFVAPN